VHLSVPADASRIRERACSMRSRLDSRSEGLGCPSPRSPKSQIWVQIDELLPYMDSRSGGLGCPSSCYLKHLNSQAREADGGEPESIHSQKGEINGDVLGS